jgi:hypothetical protein
MIACTLDDHPVSEFRDGQEIFLFSEASSPALGLSQSLQLVQGTVFLAVH